MARLRDLKIGMKVQIVKGKEDPGCFYHTDAYKYVGKIGNITEIDNNVDTPSSERAGNGFGSSGR